MMYRQLRFDLKGEKRKERQDVNKVYAVFEKGCLFRELEDVTF
jgi:hypothetical protein